MISYGVPSPRILQKPFWSCSSSERLKLVGTVMQTWLMQLSIAEGPGCWRFLQSGAHGYQRQFSFPTQPLLGAWHWGKGCMHACWFSSHMWHVSFHGTWEESMKKNHDSMMHEKKSWISNNSEIHEKNSCMNFFHVHEFFSCAWFFLWTLEIFKSWGADLAGQRADLAGLGADLAGRDFQHHLEQFLGLMPRALVSRVFSSSTLMEGLTLTKAHPNKDWAWSCSSTRWWTITCWTCEVGGLIPLFKHSLYVIKIHQKVNHILRVHLYQPFPWISKA